MEVLFSDDAAIQLGIIDDLADKGNFDFMVLRNRIALCVKALSEADKVDNLPFPRVAHDENLNNLGYLRAPLDKCLNVDLDAVNRFLVFEKSKNAVVITSLGHYNVQIGNKPFFQEIELQFENIYESDEDKLAKIKHDSVAIKESLLSHVKDENISKYTNLFDRKTSGVICPVTFDAVKIMLSSYLENNDANFRFPDKRLDTKKRNNAIIDFLKANESLLTRAVVNARCFSNVAAVTIGDDDLKKTMFTKIDIDANLMRDFSELIYYCNGKIQESNIKKQVFDFCCGCLLKGFEEQNDKIVEFKNASLGSLEYRNDYEIIRRMDILLREKVAKDISAFTCCDGKQYNKKISKLNSDELYATLTHDSDLLIKSFRKNCRKLNLNRYGKSRENHELICKKLGLKAGSLLKTKESDIVHKQHKKKGIKR